MSSHYHWYVHTYHWALVARWLTGGAAADSERRTAVQFVHNHHTLISPAIAPLVPAQHNINQLRELVDVDGRKQGFRKAVLRSCPVKGQKQTLLQT